MLQWNLEMFRISRTFFSILDIFVNRVLILDLTATYVYATYRASRSMAEQVYSNVYF